MAIGALIGAYQQDDMGGLRALFPLAGRTLVEYQVRCAAAAGASPIVVLVEAIPPALNAAFERLRADGYPVIAVSDGNEAASRFEPGELILQIADGVAPDLHDIARLADHGEPVVLVVPDDADHQPFERIDGQTRWAGIAIFDGRELGATAAMLGDWDLQSTLLRRSVQNGIARLAASSGPGQGPLFAESAETVAHFERRLLVASRGERRDWVARHLLPPVEEWATERLMETRVRPVALVGMAVGLTIAAAFSFTRGWVLAAMAMLVLSMPLDLVARRLAILRLQPFPDKAVVRRLLRPAVGLALAALGWWVTRTTGQYGAFTAALAAIAFAEADRIERRGSAVPFERWLFSRRSAIVLTIPFAIAGWWHALLLLLAAYAATSFFIVQHAQHGVRRD